MVSRTKDYASNQRLMGLTDSIKSFFKLPFAAPLFLQPHLIPSRTSLHRKGGEMLHRAAVADKALGLLMDCCRATFANREADGGFTLYYVGPNRNEVKYRVTAEMHRAAEKCIKAGSSRLRGNIDPVQIDSGIRVWREFD